MEERRTTVTRTEPTVVRDEVSSTSVTTTNDDTGFSWGVFFGVLVVAAVLVIAAFTWHPWTNTSTFTSSSTNSTIDQNSGTTSGSTSTDNGTAKSTTTTTTTNGSTNP